MQYSYTQSCSLLRTINNVTERLRTQFIHVSVKNRANSILSSTVLTECEQIANLVKSLVGANISYDNDEEINFSRVTSSIVKDETDSINITFICRRIDGTKPEFLQFTMKNVIAATLSADYPTELDGITGVQNSINNYIIVNAIIDM